MYDSPHQMTVVIIGKVNWLPPPYEMLSSLLNFDHDFIHLII